jgi:hypothetical protein
MKFQQEYWEFIADNLSKAGWSWGCISAIDSNGPTIWIADASLVQVTAGRPLASRVRKRSQAPVFPAPKRIGLKSNIQRRECC